ncbi:MAG: polysaccharide deacetylase family protein [Burkholderiaceae bacterium]
MSAMFTCSTDDGHPSDMKMAALLSRHNLSGTFFIPIKNREGPPVLSHAEIREVAARFEIGSHTYDHRFLNSVDAKQARFQIEEGKKKLEDILGAEVPGFCYPGGKYQQAHIGLVKEAGFRYARTTMNLCFSSGRSRFEMPTTCQFYPHDRSVYCRNFIRAGNWPQRYDGLALALSEANWIKRIYALFDHACEEGTVFHLWSHSHDIDKLGAWEELDRLFAYIASRTSAAGRVDNKQLAQIFHPLDH